MPRWVDDAISLLAPDTCLYCGSADALAGCCTGCREDLPWNRVACPSCAQPQPVIACCPRCLDRPPAFDAAWTPFLRLAPVRHGVARLKYGAEFRQARVLGTLMGQALATRSAPLPELMIPVPLPRRRLLRRGFNQALELARAVARMTGVPIDASSARFLRVPEDQIGQSAAKRRRNLQGVFRVARNLDGLHVALIDDVMTTGATLDALAQAARQAGARRIEAFALAREP